MSSVTEIYVDPSIAANSGAGTIGDPYGDLQYALNTATRDATNGDRFNIKAGTDEVLTAALDFTSYGAPSASAPCVLQGYTSAQGDGGIGGISGNATYSIINSTTLDFISFIDLHLHNCGAADVALVDNFCTFLNCEVNNTTGSGIVGDAGIVVAGCYIHNIGGAGIRSQSTGGLFYANYLEYGANNFSIGIWGNAGVSILENIVKVSGVSEGIRTALHCGAAIGNRVWSNGGTAGGINHPTGNTFGMFANNFVEGFSGVAGVGYLVAGNPASLFANNRAYNNTTNYSLSDILVNLGNNQDMAASPFRDPAAGDFTLTPYAQSLADWPLDLNGAVDGQLLRWVGSVMHGADFRKMRLRSRV